MIRSAILLVLLGALTACNGAMSDRPLFADKNRSASVRLADGLWLLADEDCQVDRRQPTAHWPSCAHWLQLAKHRIVGGSDATDDLPSKIFIADGRPPLIQAPYETRDSKRMWVYLALEPVRRSRSGNLVMVRLWLVPCGTVTDKASMTIKPYPGFNEGCVAEDVAALRAAAARGPSEPSDVSEWRWVR